MISVVIPSRLAAMPDGRLWLERALDCVRQQRLPAGESVEIIVGLDQGVEPPERLIAGTPGPRFANAAAGAPRGQASALNAALRTVRGEWVALLEDDDQWRSRHLELALGALSALDFVSASQRCVDPAGIQIGVFGPATPSGWVMPRRVLDKVGLFDEAFRFHLDSEWLGRLNRAIAERGHFVEGSDLPLAQFLGNRPELRTLLESVRPAKIALLRGPGHYTQVVRTENPQGGVSSIKANEELARISLREYAAIERKYGHIPW
jgi:glycosyltransferase involved in cell wall biosynthesis